jgi:hypothetical protein
MTKEKTTPKKVVLPKMAACPKDAQVVLLLKDIKTVNHMIYTDQVLMGVKLKDIETVNLRIYEDMALLEVSLKERLAFLNVKTRNIEQILIMLAVFTCVLFAAIIFKMFIL